MGTYSRSSVASRARTNGVGSSQSAMPSSGKAGRKPSLFAVPSKSHGKKSRAPQSMVYAVLGGLFFLQLFAFYVSHSSTATRQTSAETAPAESREMRYAQQEQPSGEVRRTSTVHSDPAKSLFRTAGQRADAKVLRKTGAVVHRAITSFNKTDLDTLVNENESGAGAPNNAGVTYQEAVEGREHIVSILADAGVEQMDVDTILSLPKWSSVTKLYGDGPVILGLERCQEFRENTPLDDASVGTAGMFNTGTNPFNMYIEENCIMPHNTHDSHGGMRWQVPWGKHTLASRKWTNTAGHDHKVNKTNVLPVVLVRDPYSWMQSMCKHQYSAHWPHSKEHCPNLVPNEHDRDHENPSVHVTVGFNGGAVEFDSLAHLWSRWYREYYDADYPRLMVRFEDLQFHAREMIDLVCQCAGAVARKDDAKFTYIVDAAKWGPGHTQQKQTNLISAMIKYGSDARRFSTMTKEDIKFATEVLDPELMHLFQYEQPAV